MPNLNELEIALPVAPLKLVCLDSAVETGEKMNKHLVEYRASVKNLIKDNNAFQDYVSDNYLVPIQTPRFGSGESKGVLLESVRGKDVYILLDICNHSITYELNGYTNHKSPDDHFQDLKRIIAAMTGRAHRINVIMPFLYEGRQHKRTGRESLDCAHALQELTALGVNNFITFDAHDPRVMNANPLCGFDDFNPFYQFIRSLLENHSDLTVDKDHLVVISPDEGALDRTVYFAGVLGVDTGMFYKRRDYSTIVDGKNPIVAHEFLGDSIEGKDVIIVDDMISSGESMLDTAKQLKDMNSKRVFICCTFGLFTNGLDAFDRAYANGDFDRIIITNLTYLPPEISQRDYFICAEMSKFLASIIDFMNHDLSMGHVLTPTEKIHEILKRYNRNEKIKF
ncbi:MAG: ribose-phosphate pyrophosphokinase [Eubacteriales bacterium]